MNKIVITDSSLRDGNHAVRHLISLKSVAKYCKFAESSGVNIIEVGHGNGLGASSLLIGKSKFSDSKIIKTARKNLKNTKLGVHIIPGIATINKDIKKAIEEGVDIFRVASHCTEATITKSHIEYLRNNNKKVFGVLMMSALCSTKELVENALIMESYGAEAVIIMDSTGTYLPNDVEERIKALKNNLSIDIGFHAHNNLQYAIHNSIVAATNGAVYLDACIRGFGAGAGNAQLEVLIPVLEKNNFKTNLNFAKVIKGADESIDYLVENVPTTSPVNILTGLNKLFSGFEKPIIKASQLNNIEYSSLIFELGNRKLVAGQEDLIIEVAQKIKNKING